MFKTRAEISRALEIIRVLEITRVVEITRDYCSYSETMVRIFQQHNLGVRYISDHTCYVFFQI